MVKKYLSKGINYVYQYYNKYEVRVYSIWCRCVDPNLAQKLSNRLRSDLQKIYILDQNRYTLSYFESFLQLFWQNPLFLQHL